MTVLDCFKSLCTKTLFPEPVGPDITQVNGASHVWCVMMMNDKSNALLALLYKSKTQTFIRQSFIKHRNQHVHYIISMHRFKECLYIQCLFIYNVSLYTMSLYIQCLFNIRLLWLESNTQLIFCSMSDIRLLKRRLSRATCCQESPSTGVGSKYNTLTTLLKVTFLFTFRLRQQNILLIFTNINKILTEMYRILTRYLQKCTEY